MSQKGDAETTLLRIITTDDLRNQYGDLQTDRNATQETEGNRARTTGTWQQTPEERHATQETDASTAQRGEHPDDDRRSRKG